MTPVANTLVYVVPSREAKKPPTRGVHVLFKLKAEMRRLNSVFEVPSSRDNLDLRGPKMYDALNIYMTYEANHRIKIEKPDVLVTPDTQRTCA